MKKFGINIPFKLSSSSLSLSISFFCSLHYNYLLSLLLIFPTSFNKNFALPPKRDRKKVWLYKWYWERKRKCREYFLFFLILFHMTECIFILTPCNINAISALIVINNIRKELIMIATHYGNQIATNQSTLSIIIINNIDSIIIREIASNYYNHKFL